MDPGLRTRTQEEPESPDDKLIKGDHQKADNAAVPDHLWLRVFAMGYGDPAYPARHLEALNLPPTTSWVGFLEEPRPPTGWRGALPGLRIFALRHWQSRVTRDYISWRRTNVPIGVCDTSKPPPLVQYHWERRAVLSVLAASDPLLVSGEKASRKIDVCDRELPL